MAQLPVLDMNESVTPHHATLLAVLEQLGTPIGANDTLIAAHALVLGATLVSANVEFDRVPGLQLENRML